MLTLDFPEVPEELLQRMIVDIVQQFRPEKVILFGSYAWGTPRHDSDVDLLVILESAQRPAQRSAEMSLVLYDR